MTKKRKTDLAIGLAAACIAVLCTAGACNGIAKEEKLLCPAVTTSTTEITTTTTQPTTTAPVTTTVPITTTSPITTAMTCITAETTTTTTDQVTATDTTVHPTTTPTATTTTTPATTEPYHGQTSGDYIYINGFGWVFNEGGGGCGETNYEMYCNGNKIGCFG